MTGTGTATADDVLAGLDPEQSAVARAVRGPVCVLAGAGTGKTRAITHRIAYAVHSGAVDPSELLAVTFTTRAAGELRTRLRALGVPTVQARTFHSAALRQLSYFYERTSGRRLPRVVDSKLGLVARAAGGRGRRGDPALLRDLAGEIEWAKAATVEPERYPEQAARAGRVPPVPATELAAIYARYEEVKAEADLLDFEDLLLATAGLIEEDPRVAAQIRARYRVFVVDEYQDVNPAQQRLLEAWLGGREEICVVGDVGQTIYSFSGASPGYLLEFPRRYPAATVIRLVRDYRSTPQVVGLANAIRDRGPAAERLPLVAYRPAGPPPQFTDYPAEPAEAAAVAARCRELLAEGLPAREIAILYRINAQSQSYEQALSSVGVPYVVHGGERFFERAEVRQAIVLLRGAVRGVDEGQPLVAGVEHVLSALGWTRTAPAGRGAARERWEGLAALVQLAEELAAREPDSGLPRLVAELEERAAVQHAPRPDGVTLASLHAAKGLEWDAVFLVGLVDGVLPITYAVTEGQLDEERRLFYVGVTRARRQLSLSWSLARTPGGRRRAPSRFLDGLRPPSPTRPARSSLPATALEGPLAERLRGWRLERARVAGQPAYCIFSDATLAAIVAGRPDSPTTLAAIPGIGPRKLTAYAEEILQIVRETT